MNHQYDFEEQLISERIPVIMIPNFQPLISSRRKVGSLNNQTLKNIELYLQQSKNRQIQRIKQLKSKQQFIGQQIEKQQIKKQRKIKEIQAQQKERLLKQCTFKPNINTKGSKRGLNEFLQNQNDHLKKIQTKKRNLRMAIENEKQKQTYRPKINPNSSKSRKNEAPIYERLYALKDKENIPLNIDDLNLQNTFKPNISQKSKKMSRNAPIQDLLYGDALRRQEKSKDILYTQNSEMIKPEKQVNLNNQKYAAQKFIREYFSILQNLGINLSIHHKIDYIMFNQLLKSMGFIKQDQQSQDGISVNERGLVYDAYSIIQKHGTNARNVCVFLLALIGIYHINPINFQEGQQSMPEKELNLDETSGRKMQKHFDILFRNRLNCQNYKKNSQKQYDSCSFQPKINKNSDGLAQKFRTQMLQEANQLLQNYPQLQYSIPQDGVISHTDLLVLHNMAKQIQRKQTKQERQNKGMEQCTFKPTTLSTTQQTMKNSKVSNFDSKLGEKKSFQLYNYYKSLQSKKQSLRVSREVDNSECTFAPNLKKSKISSTTPYAKHIDETLYRIHKGRQQKQQKIKFLERGQKNTSNIRGSRITNEESLRNTSRRIDKSRNGYLTNQENEDDVPTLILDVNLGDKTDRIKLYAGDQDRLQQVAHEFSIKHELDEEAEGKLLQMLEVQLNNVLQQIQEGQECEDYENQN